MSEGDNDDVRPEVEALRPPPLWKVYSAGRLRALYSIVEYANGSKRAKITAHLSCSHPHRLPRPEEEGREAI